MLVTTKTQFRYHCEFNITKHHSAEGTDLSSSATDLLSLELDAAMNMLDPMTAPLSLPTSREEAVKLNRNNLSAAVSNQSRDVFCQACSETHETH